MSKASAYPELFRRHPKNPILTPDMWPYPVHVVFNPAATLLQDGTTLVLARCEDRRGISHFCCARSENGIENWTIDPEPSLCPDISRPEETWGIEDPRITYIEEFGSYAITFTAYGETGPAVALAMTRDFVTFKRRGVVMPPNDKDAAILPRRIGGEFRMIHRPMIGQEAHMWISSSPDLRHWGKQRLLLNARRGAWWDAGRIGLSPPPIETPEGWLVIYHGAQRKVNGSVYRLGLAMLDLEEPEVCKIRCENWVMAPETSYEQVGDVPYVVFPCGWTLRDDHLMMYYGAADATICLAEASVKELVEYLNENGRAPDRDHGEHPLE